MALRKAVLIRIALSLVAGLLIAAVVTEVGFRLEGNTISRPPKTMILVIPKGTSENVARGMDLLPIKNINFMVGDTLQVRNQDTVTHSLGPLVIPAGTTASIRLDQAKNMVYLCSFETTQVFGLNVHDALTLGTRIEGFLLAGIPLGLLMMVYSLVVWPIKPKDASPQA
jgi:hypothetical protein